MVRKVSIIISTFLIVLAGTFFGVQFMAKTGVFKVFGKVYYDESLNEAETEALKTIFNEEVKLDKDVSFSAYDTFEWPELNENEFLVNIYVPVTDFYDMRDGVSFETPEEFFSEALKEESSFKVIDISELDYKFRLLELNGAYYLDDLKAGAVFRVVKAESEYFSEEILPLIGEIFTRTLPSKETILTFAQTGVTALSRRMNTKMNQVGSGAYFAEGIKDFLSSFDLTHTSNESSFSNYASASNICSDRRFFETLTMIGLDIVELTGNHNVDCGDASASESIDIYVNNGIRVVGGGKNAEEAALPLQIEQKGNNITMFAYNLSTGGATHDNTPGANQYYEEVASEQISSAKARGDFVIVDIQYYECNEYASTTEDTTCDYAGSMAGDQVGFFRHLIDLGADIVVGTSAHQPQTFELYGDGVIYYGLGNLFFDQFWWPGTTRSLVLVHYFKDGELLQTRIMPTVYDSNMRTELMSGEDRRWFLERLANARP
ncbi:MAG: CapA family protein [Candidatus Saccharibacteria bacterium]|nr:CapA family protein [Candidatus Saccharibacteria bacterium]